LAVALGLPGWLGACTSGARERSLRFWAMGREGEVAHELLDDFRREHPQLQLRIEQLPWTSAHEKLLTAYAGDATPDVAQMGNTWLAEMAAIDAIEPLQPWLDRTPSIDRADHFAGIWDTNLVDGRLVGVAWYVDTRLLFVRRDLLAQAGVTEMPRSWGAWRDALAALQRGPVKTPPLLLPLNEFEPLLALALQQPEPLLRDRARFGNFAGAGFQRALGLYLEMFARGLAPNLDSTQVGNVWQEFGRGTFAFYISGPWNIGEFRRRLGAEAEARWTTASMPGPDGPGASTAGGSSLVMFRRSSMKQQAWQLIEYLSRPSVQQRFYALTGNLPPRRSSWAGPLAADEKAAAFREQLERVRPTPAVPEWERIANEMQHFAARAVHERAAPDAVGRALDARVDAFLEKRRWMQDRDSRRSA
jgi:multiple sugar transport system substrate-binding protein